MVVEGAKFDVKGTEKVTVGDLMDAVEADAETSVLAWEFVSATGAKWTDATVNKGASTDDYKTITVTVTAQSGAEKVYTYGVIEYTFELGTVTVNGKADADWQITEATATSDTEKLTVTVKRTGADCGEKTRTWNVSLDDEDLGVGFSKTGTVAKDAELTLEVANPYAGGTIDVAMVYTEAK